MPILIRRGKVVDAHTVWTEEPLTAKGAQPILLVEPTDAETLASLASFLVEQGQHQDAWQLLRDFEGIMRAHFRWPVADFLVLPLLRQGKVNEAIPFARQIDDDEDHDVALTHVALKVMDGGEEERALEIVREIRQEKRRGWAKFLVEWGAALQKVRQRYSPEELRQQIASAWSG